MAIAKVLVTVAVPFVSVILYVLYVGYKKRAQVDKLRKSGMAMPQWSWWFGHLLVLKDHLERLPADANVYYAMQDLVLKEHADTEVFLMDYWPMFDPVLMLSGPEISVQVASTYNLQKPDSHGRFFRPVVGGESLITMNDHEWKIWRALFNPGFSATHMTTLIPSIVDSVERFCNLLRTKVDGEVFPLDAMTTRLTMEIITKTTLDTDLDNQVSEHSLSHALNTILDWHSFWDPRILLNPLRPFVQWYYSRVMYKFIRKEVDTRFKEFKLQKSSSLGTSSKRAKSVIALALEGYIAQKLEGDHVSEEDIDALELDEDFAQVAVNQIRLFIMAGNDSTSSTITYCFHVLSKYPEALSKLRKEHDTVLGPGDDAAAQLKANPALLNQCKYTLAVIKETLRLYPPASSLRQGRGGVFLTDKESNTYPSEDLNATIMHHFVHRNPRFWPRPTEFLPERWLVEPGHELYVSQSSGAYRPFELGPRNCIGQTLVFNEICLTLVLTARTVNIAPAYEEWDDAQLKNEGTWSKLVRRLGLKKDVTKMVMGERAYQTSRSGSPPANGYPCRVSAA